MSPKLVPDEHTVIEGEVNWPDGELSADDGGSLHIAETSVMQLFSHFEGLTVRVEITILSGR